MCVYVYVEKDTHILYTRSHVFVFMAVTFTRFAKTVCNTFAFCCVICILVVSLQTNLFYASEILNAASSDSATYQYKHTKKAQDIENTQDSVWCKPLRENSSGHDMSHFIHASQNCISQSDTKSDTKPDTKSDNPAYTLGTQAARRATPISASVSRHCTLVEVYTTGASRVITGNGTPHIIYLHEFRNLMKAAVRHKGVGFSAKFRMYIDTADSSSCKDSTKQGYSHRPRYFETLGNIPHIFPFAITGNAFQPLAFLSFPLPLDRYFRNMEHIVKVLDPMQYHQKQTKAVWHGSRSGYLAWSRVFAPHMTRTPRDTLIELADNNPDLLEASYVKTPMAYIYKFKYIIAISGNSWSSILAEALWSNSVVIRQDPKMYSWYESMLVAWTHYIPVDHDLNDLISKIQWAKSHPDECANISRAASRFALEKFNVAAQLQYTYNVVERNLNTNTTGMEH